jgi:hypothetical protein
MQILRLRKLTRSLLMGILLVLVALPVCGQSVHRAKVKIDVGPTVQVSKDFAKVPHFENLAAADPEHPGRLLACSMVATSPAQGDVWATIQNCYLSVDGGKSWQATLKADQGSINDDPTAVFGHGDTVYAATLNARIPDHPKDDDHPDALDTDTVVFKSTDGGRTWNESSRFPVIDREYILFDRTQGKYAGRLYVIGHWYVDGINGQWQGRSVKVFRSLDDGKTFLGPVHAEYPEGTDLMAGPTGAILSDGTLVMMFGLIKKGRRASLEPDTQLGPNAELHAIFSKDGGEHLTKSVKIADWTLDRARSEGGLLGQMAVDPGSNAFRDRLYVVYPAIVSDRIQVLFSYSADQGNTWSKPTVVNDDRNPGEAGKGPDHMLPSVSVNKDGVVLVSWYDRREARDNLGWRVRVAASLDGGETFSASLPVTETANSYSAETVWAVGTGAASEDSASLISMKAEIYPLFVSGGHTSGLVADADGSFHPTWVDNHTGVFQLWTAAIRVSGPVIKHGAPELADLDDISKSVALDLSNGSFDRKTGTFTVTAQLRNTSRSTVQGPVKVRVLSLESALGIAEITNADNGQDGTGAVWDFSSLLPGGTLESLKVSTPRTLTFHVSDARPLSPGKDFKPGLLSLDARVLGKLRKDQDRVVTSQRAVSNVE